MSDPDELEIRSGVEVVHSRLQNGVEVVHSGLQWGMDWLTVCPQ